MTRYDHILAILDQAIGGPAVNIGEHGAFWRDLTRDEFVQKRVIEIALVAVGNGADSNLVKALKGQSPFGDDLTVPPAGAIYPRMPADLAPVADIDIAFIEKWINDGCPEDPFPNA
jgi:hypothetical protein